MKRTGPSKLVYVDVALLFLMLGTAAYTQLAGTLRYVPPIYDHNQQFWQSRKTELCGEASAALPASSGSRNPQLLLTELYSTMEFQDSLWKEYVECQEPRTVVIDEALLHFVVNEFDRFETDPEPAFRRIEAIVDDNVGTHNLIYISGHTDDSFTDEYNYLLSYRRALTVVDVVDRHLRAQNKRKGPDYLVFPVGMGESQLPVRQPGEDDNEWRKRSRRIEISFRSISNVGAGSGR